MPWKRFSPSIFKSKENPTQFSNKGISRYLFALLGVDLHLRSNVVGRFNITLEGVMTEPSLMVVTVVAVVGEEPIKEKSPWKTYVREFKRPLFLFFKSCYIRTLLRMTSHYDGKVCCTTVFLRFRTFDKTPTQFLFAKYAHTYIYQSVEISSFFYHAVFTWNQFEGFLKCKVCHFTTF